MSKQGINTLLKELESLAEENGKLIFKWTKLNEKLKEYEEILLEIAESSHQNKRLYEWYCKYENNKR